MSYDAASRRYAIRTGAFMAGYAAVNTAAIFGAFDDLSAPGSWLFALVVAAPVAGQIWATLALMRESDEFVRALMAKRFILASGLAMAVFSAWGFLESYAAAPHAPGWLVFALFWACYGLVTPFVRSTR
jgi:putative oxidoreductase